MIDDNGKECKESITSEGGPYMIDVAKMTSKGQVTIPVELRNYLGLKEGEKVAFIQGEDGNIYIANASKLALKTAQKAFEGEADKAGLNGEDDVVSLVREIRDSK